MEPHLRDTRRAVREAASPRFSGCLETVDELDPFEALARKEESQEQQQAPRRRYIPLSTALREDVRSGDTLRLDDEEMAWRIAAWHSLLSYVFQNGVANPWQALKNLLAVARRISPEYLDGISQTDLAILLGETRAAVSAREIRVVEGIVKRWGFRGFHGLGNTKGEVARMECAKSAKGNGNRAAGEKAKRMRKQHR